MGYMRAYNHKKKDNNMDLSQILNNVTPQETKTNDEKSALPAGNYSVKIEKVEGKTNATTGNKGVSLQMRVFGNKFNNYCLFDYMALTGNETALTYSLPKLKTLGKINGSENTDAWVGKIANVSVSVDKKDAARNIVWSYSEHVLDDNAPIQASSNGAFNSDSIPF